jgi:hypothetical protein
VGPANAGLLGRFHERPPFEGGCAGRYADDRREAAPLEPGRGDVGEDLAQEPARRLQVGDDAVAQRPDHLDPVGGAADKLLCGLANADDVGMAAAVEAERHHGRLAVEHAVLGIPHQRVGRTEIDTDALAADALAGAVALVLALYFFHPCLPGTRTFCPSSTRK